MQPYDIGSVSGVSTWERKPPADNGVEARAYDGSGSNTVQSIPRRASWYATEDPTTPPPTMATVDMVFVRHAIARETRTLTPVLLANIIFFSASVFAQL